MNLLGMFQYHFSPFKSFWVQYVLNRYGIIQYFSDCFNTFGYRKNFNLLQTKLQTLSLREK